MQQRIKNIYKVINMITINLLIATLILKYIFCQSTFSLEKSIIFSSYFMKTFLIYDDVRIQFSNSGHILACITWYKTVAAFQRNQLFPY